MKILLVSNYRPDKQQSMIRFSSMLANGLTRYGHEVKIVEPAIVAGRLAGEGSRLKKWLGYIDKLIIFPKVLNKASKWADIVHVCDHSNSMYSAMIMDRPSLVTCHDMMAVRSALGEFPENKTGTTGRIYQWLIRRGMKMTSVIVCVSNATLKDVTRIIGLRKHRYYTVYNGLNYAYGPMDDELIATHLHALGIDLDRPFLFHIGGNQWYKNRIGVLKIFQQLLTIGGQQLHDLDLILAGEPWTEEVKELVRTAGISGRVIQLTNISNEQLNALYNRAVALLFPSLCEGFGWPIIEAQACGCMVITSNQAPMTEVGGDAAMYINPRNALEAAKKSLDYIGLNSYSNELALSNAKRFSQDEMIRGYIKIYNEIRYKD